MAGNNTILRKLNDMEAAFTWSNARLPLCVVCVLHLQQAPAASVWVTALEKLQKRHALLRCEIIKKKDGFYFKSLDPVPPILFTQVERETPHSWQQIATRAVNTIFHASGPLMKAWWVRKPGSEASEFIICFHHAIIDGASARLILHEILCLSGGLALEEPVSAVKVPKFPAPYQWGKGLLKKLLGFSIFQFKEEIRYRSGGLANAIPHDSKNAIISFRLEPDLTRKLSVKAGRAGLGLNTVLLAAITMAVILHRYPEDTGKRARVLSFADLRPALQPVVSRQEMGCYISMLRLSVPLGDGSDLWELARKIRRAMFKASRRGDVFLMSIMSEQLVKLAFALKNTRLGIGAISFIGKLDLQQEYGPIQLQHVRAFITNNQYGPELSAFGKILFGAVSLDFTYLEAETSREQAEQMILTIKQLLEKIAE